MRLDEAIASLGHSRVQVLIVSDGQSDEDWPENPIDNLHSADWPLYEVHSPRTAGSHSVTYQSPQAEVRFPDQRNVAIRVELLMSFG